MQNIKEQNRYVVENWSTENPRRLMWVWVNEVTDTHVIGYANSVGVNAPHLTSACTWPLALANNWTWVEA